MQSANETEVGNLLKDYFTCLYANTVESYIDSNVSGYVPDTLAEYVSKRTLDEGRGNPAIPIHFPRFFEMNGRTVCTLELLRIKPDNGEEQPCIRYSVVNNTEDTVQCFVQLDLLGGCINNGSFSKSFTAQGAYYKRADTDPDTSLITDFIKLKAIYDVKMIKEDGSYKILEATEANIKHGYKNRLSLLNNDFAERLPYLFIEQYAEETGFIDNSDVKRYGDEKAFIQSFFEKLPSLDNTRMSLLKVKWENGIEGFEGFLQLVKADGDKGNDGLSVMFKLDLDYKSRYDIKAFPLKVNMKKIVKLDSFDILPHPAYSDNSRKYIVKFNASVERLNGFSGKETNYRYDYFVTVSESGGKYLTDEIKLKEYYRVDSK